MDTSESEPASIPTAQRSSEIVYAILAALSLSHLLNDTIQSLLPAVYPILKESYSLSYTQIGFITFAFQVTASLLQPLVGMYTDKHPKPYSLATGMCVTLIGLIMLSVATSFPMILCAAALVGVGSSVFHPESSRVARLASGGRYGFAQSLFQVGGNAGSALGPLLAAFIIVPRGQQSLAWFAILAVTGIVLLTVVARWYQAHLVQRVTTKRAPTRVDSGVPPMQIKISIAILLCLIFSKYFYLVSLTSYYQFYLIETFHVSEQSAQIHLFVFLGSVAVGTFAGGPVGDKLGFKTVIWASILGVLPFTLLLPHSNLFWTTVLTVPIGLILASAFSAIMVYAQELLPSRVGMVAGLFFGFAFGMAGLGAAVLGWLADQTSLKTVYLICSLLPLIGILTIFLPDLRKPPVETP